MTMHARNPSGNDASAARFRRAQWRMLLASMLCYLFFYTGRQNIGFARDGLENDLKLTTTMIGWISGGMLLGYGIGQAINGNLGDKYGARWMMSLGAILSVAVNWITSFGNSFIAILIPWTINGYVQSLAWAPSSRLISNWWAHHQRGRAFGFYVFSAGFSSVLTYGLCILVLSYGDWRWLFRLPVLLLLFGGILFFLIARDKPEDLGYEPVSDQEKHNDDETMLERYLHAFGNWRFLLACFAIGCENTARYGLLIWVPSYYLGKDWKQEPGSAWIMLALPIGMALGAIVAGQISDRLFQSNRSKPIAIFLVLAAGVSMLVYVVPPEQVVLGMVLLFLAGFFVYGPQASFWALCPDLLGQKRTSTGVGMMNACAYGFAAAGEVAIGSLIDMTGTTGIVFPFVAAMCMVGAIAIVFVRR